LSLFVSANLAQGWNAPLTRTTTLPSIRAMPTLQRFALVISVFVTFSLRAEWIDVTANLAGMKSECGNLCLLSVVPGQDKIIAGIAKRGLWQTTDGGTTWTQMGQGAGSDTIVNRPSEILYDPKDTKTFWESGIYNSSGVYRTDDGGQTFKHLGSARHNDYVSVNFADPQRRMLLAGGHEQSRMIWKSLDGGTTWTNIGVNLPEGTKFTTHPMFIGANTYIVNCSGWGKGTGGVFRTTDGGASWTQVSTNEAKEVPLRASDGSLYWLLMADRGLIRSTDDGKTWTQVCGGGVLKASRLIELPEGKLVATAGKSIKISSDHGATWTAILSPTPAQPAGIVYAPARQSFYIWYWDCKDIVATNAIWRHEYRLTAK
jgi:photosystem II stability/assembly factor-like uncharacterized protein